MDDCCKARWFLIDVQLVYTAGLTIVACNSPSRRHEDMVAVHVYMGTAQHVFSPVSDVTCVTHNGRRDSKHDQRSALASRRRSFTGLAGLFVSVNPLLTGPSR